jgi:hypothetical protein
MTVTFEQFLPSCHLRVVPVLDFEPRRSLRLCDVWTGAMLCDYSLQIQFADALE